MNDEAAFVQAMQESPEDATLRLVFADWLEERGDPRGELIRLLHTLTQAVKVRGRDKLEDRLRSLLAAGVQPVGPFITNSLGMKFAWIPAGTFLMGSPKEEKGRMRGNHESEHQATLSKGFYLGIHLVTQAVWQPVMGNNWRSSDYPQGADLPVEYVSWQNCREFCQRLSEGDGCSYRMPTEAEWEYACRAGTTTPFYFGGTISTDQANYDGNFPYATRKKGVWRNKATPAGSFPPNAWGLYDMHGNVFEWCSDGYGEYPNGEVVDPQGTADERSRVLRGGSYNHAAKHARSAFRLIEDPRASGNLYGFRVAMTPAPTHAKQGLVHHKK